MEGFVGKFIEIELRNGRQLKGTLRCYHQGILILSTNSSSLSLSVPEVHVLGIKLSPKRTENMTIKWFDEKKFTLKRPRLSQHSPDCISPTYWSKRYLLFSRFDEGITLDSESWYSVTPECIAQHIASRCRGLVLDVCAGAGGNSIQFALHRKINSVVSVELDSNRIALARKNAAIYEVPNTISWINSSCQDVLMGMKTGQVDFVFLSPPWGGPGCQLSDSFSVLDIQLGSKEYNGVWLFHESKRVAKMGVIYYLPKNASRSQLKDDLGEDCVDYELHNLKRRGANSICAYYGEYFKS